MKTKRSFLSTAIAVASLPMMMAIGTQAMAYEIDIDVDDNADTAETLEVYGTVRMSYDYGNSDVSNAELEADSDLVDGDTTLSSNTSIFGVRGSYNFEQSPYTVLWQIEQAYTPDTGGLDTVSARDTFLGVKTPVGLFRAGYMDTPYKVMGLTNSMFVTTAGDPFALLGKSYLGPRVDLRASNSLQYNTEIAGVKLAAQYGQGSNGAAFDDASNSLYSGSAAYTVGGLTLSAAVEKWSNPYEEAAPGSLEAWRIGAKYVTGPLTVGAIYGDYSTDADPRPAGDEPTPLDGTLALESIEREEYGLYASYKVLPKTTVGAQWMHAGESEFQDDDDADQFSIAVMQQVFPRLQVHAIYTQTQNGDNANFNSGDYAHGDTVFTTNGNDPSIFSVGAAFTF